MNPNQAKKLIILVASLLLGATVCGVWQHNRDKDELSRRTNDAEITAAICDYAGGDMLEQAFAETGDAGQPDQSAIVTNQPPSRRETTRSSPWRSITGQTICALGDDNAAGAQLRPAAGGWRRHQTFSLVPPPPPSSPSLANESLQPAPVQSRAVYASGTLLDNITLSAVIDKRAIFKIAPSYRREHGLPAAISLGPGEEFESLSVVHIDGNDVTICEGQKRIVKSIASLR